MTSLDKLKKQIKEEASDNPDKFFATDVLREKDFTRSECENCGLYFWSSTDRDFCGEPECSGGYTFINNSPIDEEYSYIESWEKYRDFMSDRGYEPIDRYPVVARWRNDVEFVGGSIYNFQPYVVSGEAEPPAEELVIPQPSLRFNDVDNVGITGRHYVLHNHIGQTCFKRENYDQDRYFRDMFEFAVDELGIPKEKLVLHEDAWGGGGNLGACMEFFVDGLELWNQVYMFYRQTPDGYEELDLKVLDMGMGQERITWISHGTETSYECVMPFVLDKMKNRTDIEVDEDIWEDFLPYSGNLNIDEVDDIEEEWAKIAEEIGLSKDELKNAIRPTGDLYSVAEHSKALLFALADGKLPSNTGGGHNLRMVYRRAKDFIEKHDWDLDMKDIVEWHAEELKPMFPELEDSLGEVKEILEVEEEKYYNAREKAREKLEGVDDPSVDEMIELYESHGVSPEMMEEHGLQVPEDFYTMVAEDDETVAEEEERWDLETEETELLYYGEPEPYLDVDEDNFSFIAHIEEVSGEWVVLDRTMFYPEGGGQLYDKGTLNGEQIEEVQKQENVVLHRVPGHDFEEGKKVKGVVNGERRKQLTQHHTATHLVNGASKNILGNHIWQAGASKTLEKGRLDITHYEKLDREDLDEIEEEVNKFIESDYTVKREFMAKKDAESQYGFRIYQGGAAPGNEIRVINIDDVDVEACGGTHVRKTSNIGKFVVTGSNKVQDGVIRVNYKAGIAAEEYLQNVRDRVETAWDLLDREDIMYDNPRQVERELCSIYSVEPEHLLDTLERFVKENEEMKERITEMSLYMDEDLEPETVSEHPTLVEHAEELYKVWRENEKKIEGLESSLESVVRQRVEDRYLKERVPTENIGLLIQIVQKLSRDLSSCIVLVGEKGAVAGSYHEDFNADEELEDVGDNIQGDENFAKTFDLN